MAKQLHRLSLRAKSYANREIFHIIVAGFDMVFSPSSCTSTIHGHLGTAVMRLILEVTC